MALEPGKPSKCFIPQGHCPFPRGPLYFLGDINYLPGGGWSHWRHSRKEAAGTGAQTVRVQ